MNCIEICHVTYEGDKESHIKIHLNKKGFFLLKLKHIKTKSPLICQKTNEIHQPLLETVGVFRWQVEFFNFAKHYIITSDI